MDQSKQSFRKSNWSKWLICFDPSIILFLVVIIVTFFKIPTEHQKTVSKILPVQIHREVEQVNILIVISDIQTHIEIGIVKDKVNRFKDYFWKNKN